MGLGAWGDRPTQAHVNAELGRQGLALLAQGVPVDVALSALLRKDPDREIRQVHGLDAERAFCHTGASCVPWGEYGPAAVQLFGRVKQ